eukprot:jgi/Chlat1/4939/Chrsp31S04848
MWYRTTAELALALGGRRRYAVLCGPAARMGRASPSSPPPVAMAAAWMLSLALLAACASALSVDEFYSFGAANGDKTMKKCYSCSSNLVPLPSAVPVFGSPSIRGLYINSNGALHFKKLITASSSVNFPFPQRTTYYSMVAGFWTALDTRCPDCGETTYRTVDDTAVLAGISDDAREAFPTEQLAAGFAATSAVIVTWNKVKRCCSFTEEAGTFQIVIAFNTDTTFLFLLYASDRPQPSLATVYSYHAQAGFDVGNGIRGYSLPGGRTAAIANTTTQGSNIGQPGKWCFGLSTTQTIGTIPYAGPYTLEECSDYIELGASGGFDACGQHRTLAWDIDNDGAFDDAVGDRPYLDNFVKPPGVYTIRVRASSPSPCAASPDPIVLDTTLTVPGPRAFIIRSLTAETRTDNNEAHVGERFRVTPVTDIPYCQSRSYTVDCGPDNVRPDPSVAENFCQYNSPGDKVITAMVESAGFVATAQLVVTVNTVSMAGPYQLPACGVVRVAAAAGQDACGHNRVFKWDFDGDGAFDDASGSFPLIDNKLRHLPLGVRTISAQVSSPSCPASPTIVRTTTVNITTTPPVINKVSASTPGGGPNVIVGSTIKIITSKTVQTCLPFTQTVDCGSGNVAPSGTEACRYDSTGVKVITVTLVQAGFTVSQSNNINVVRMIIGGPYRTGICATIRLTAATVADACGAARSLAWDLDNDGVFDDATGPNPNFNAYNQGLSPGVHTISVRASSSSCPDSPPEVVSTTIDVTATPLSISSVATSTTSGSAIASVQERIQVSVQRSTASCAPDNLTIDCGPDSVGNEVGYCRYSSPGIKTITTTVAQFGNVVSRSRNIMVATLHLGGPYHTAPCRLIRLAAPTTIDACGRPRLLAWDFDNDGLFGDLTGSAPYLDTGVFNLGPGVHPVRVQFSSSPACPASPTEVYTINVTVTAGVKLAIRGISIRPAGGSPVAVTGEDIVVDVSKTVIYCLPSDVTLDCGAGSVSTGSPFCRYNTPGLKVINATLTQNGVSVSKSHNITVSAYYFFSGPYRTLVCGRAFLAAGGGVDECGQVRNPAWEFNGDGLFDDATGRNPTFYANLRPGVYPISVRFSSSNPASCPDAVPVILTTDVIVTGSIKAPVIYSVRGVPASGNARANVNESIQSLVSYKLDAYCLPFTLSTNCGPGHVGNKEGYCQYDTSGVKLITVTLSQEGFEVSSSFNVTVITTAPSCTTAAFPEGRVRGKRGCSTPQWRQLVRCYHPDNIKPYTKLSAAFASRASEDARLIERYFGNRTIAQALIIQTRRVDLFAREATTALLNADTTYYAQCPLSVKLDFRHGLYNSSNSTRLTTAINKFLAQNNVQNGCPSSDDFESQC